MSSPDAVWRRVRSLAHELGDVPEPAAKEGFANKVYVGARHVFKVYDRPGRDAATRFKRERRALCLLARMLPPEFGTFVPAYVRAVQIRDEGVNGYLAALTRLPGEVSLTLPPAAAHRLGEFLCALHTIGPFTRLWDIAGLPSAWSAGAFVSRSVPQLLTKIRRAAGGDIPLAEMAGARITCHCDLSLLNHGPLCLVHRDIHLGNLLFIDESLTGVLDWEGAHIGPAEWDMAIVRQRFPNEWPDVLRGYGRSLSDPAMHIFGLFQSLRFWASHCDDAPFVARQRRHIEELLSTTQTAR